MPPTQVTIAGYLISDTAAKEIIDWQAERLALDIPERDIDRSDGASENPIVWEETSPRHRLPDVFDPHGILPKQQGRQVLESAHDSQLSASDP